MGFEVCSHYINNSPMLFQHWLYFWGGGGVENSMKRMKDCHAWGMLAHSICGIGTCWKTVFSDNIQCTYLMINKLHVTSCTEVLCVGLSMMLGAVLWSEFCSLEGGMPICLPYTIILNVGVWTSVQPFGLCISFVPSLFPFCSDRIEIFNLRWAEFSSVTVVSTVRRSSGKFHCCSMMRNKVFPFLWALGAQTGIWCWINGQVMLELPSGVSCHPSIMFIPRIHGRSFSAVGLWE